MTEQFEEPEESKFQAWLMQGFENCNCPSKAPHDLWRHPLLMPLLTCTLIFAFNPEVGKASVNLHWKDRHYLRGIATGVFYFLWWVVGIVGMLALTAIVSTILSLYAIVRAPYTFLTR